MKNSTVTKVRAALALLERPGLHITGYEQRQLGSQTAYCAVGALKKAGCTFEELGEIGCFVAGGKPGAGSYSIIAVNDGGVRYHGKRGKVGIRTALQDFIEFKEGVK